MKHSQMICDGLNFVALTALVMAGLGVTFMAVIEETSLDFVLGSLLIVAGIAIVAIQIVNVIDDSR